MNTVESPLSVEQRLYGLMIVWAEAKFAFPSFDKLPDLDWDQRLQDFIPRVTLAEDVGGCYRTLMEFAALLKDGHTVVVPLRKTSCVGSIQFLSRALGLLPSGMKSPSDLISVFSPVCGIDTSATC